MVERRALSRDPEFLKFWAGQAIWWLVGPVSGLAIPLIAVVLLSAGPAEMGLLGAMRNLPFLVVGLLAGVIVDRVRRRPVLIATDLGQALLLGIVPAAAVIGVLRMELLYVVSFLTGSLGVIAIVAYQSFLPSLVGRDRLVAANSRLEGAASVAGIAGSAIGGFLIQAVTAPIALLASAAGPLVTAASLVWVRVAEPPPRDRHERGPIIGEIREGLVIVLGDARLRSILLCGATHNIFSNGMLVALYVLFATDRLGLTPVELGIVFAAGGPGSLLGAVFAGRLVQLGGLGPTIGSMQVLTGVARLAMPLAALSGLPVVLLALGEFTLGVARSIFNVNQLSLRQSITPDHQQGRMNASIRFLMWAVVPFGALLGGALGEAIGLLPTIWIGVAGTFAASLWIFLSPIGRMRERPEALPA